MDVEELVANPTNMAMKLRDKACDDIEDGIEPE